MTGIGYRRGENKVQLQDEISATELLRVTRLARELRLTDQMLSMDVDAVNVQPFGGAPAWTTTDGTTVTFAYDLMPPISAIASRVNVAVWLGTNAHELGHVLFTPREGSKLIQRVRDSARYAWRLAHLHNIVEDQRQERLLIARFSPWTAYLTAALSHHLVADDKSAWLLMAGRTWLPADLRTVAKARMVADRGQLETDEVTRLVGEYQRLVDPGETEADAAWDILMALCKLFENDPPITSSTGCGGSRIEAGEPDTSGAEDGAPQTADEADADQGDSGDEGDSSGSGDSAGDGDSTDREADGQSDSEQPSDGGGQGAGNNLPTDRPFDNRKAKRELRNAAQDMIDSDEDAAADLDNVKEALDHGRPGDSAEGDATVGVHTDASDGAHRLRRLVSDALLDLKDESEPGWIKRTDYGRLNVRRWFDPTSTDDIVFDRYESGQMDAAEMEVVLLVDVSSSMARYVAEVGEAVWAIRHAVDDLEGRMTVLSYNSSQHRVMASPQQRPDGRMFIPQAEGGTNPTTALQEAYRLLSNASATNRMLVILSDGDWYDRTEDEIIILLRRAGIITVIALLGRSAGENTHHCEYAGRIDNPAELGVLFRHVAVDQIRKRLG